MASKDLGKVRVQADSGRDELLQFALTVDVTWRNQMRNGKGTTHSLLTDLRETDWESALDSLADAIRSRQTSALIAGLIAGIVLTLLVELLF